MILILLTVAFLGIFLASGILLIRCAEAFDVFRNPRAVQCPLVGREATVSIAPFTSAVTTAMGSPRLPIRDCSLWHENKSCRGECRGQLLPQR
ncbi:MAG: hypothetical protein OEV30_11100 [Ignavibacteria bacterium]|nr:hypothetical protein [Ignavibacteria bacterium]